MTTADAEAAIAKLVVRYAVLNDAGDFHAVANLFTPDAVFTRPSGGPTLVGREAILAAFLQRPPRIARHLVSTILVDVESPATARCRSTLLIYTAPADASLPAQADAQALLRGFRDRLVMTSEGWRFAERTGWLDLRIG